MYINILRSVEKRYINCLFVMFFATLKKLMYR